MTKPTPGGLMDSTPMTLRVVAAIDLVRWELSLLLGRVPRPRRRPAAAHRYSSPVGVERISRRALLTDPRKAYTAVRTQAAIKTINIGSQSVRW